MFGFAVVGAVIAGEVARSAVLAEENRRRAALGLPPKPFPSASPRREPEQRPTVDDGSTAAAAFVFGMAMAGSHDSPPESCSASSFDSGSGGDFGGGGASGEF
jgi:uncharacterized membrane protein YgcG